MTRNFRIATCSLFAALSMTPAISVRAQDADDTKTIIAMYRDAQVKLAALQAKAASGDTQAQFLLGAAYYDRGIPGIDRDDEAAMKWLTAAATKGNAEAMTALAIAFAQGRTVPSDEIQASQWLRRASQAGDWRGVFLHLYTKKGGGLNDNLVSRFGALTQDRDLQVIFDWYLNEANSGNVTAQAKLSNAYAFGRGVKAYEEMAIFWAAKASRGGSKEAATALKNLLANKPILTVRTPTRITHESPNYYAFTLAKGAKIYVLGRNPTSELVIAYEPKSRKTITVPFSAF